MNPKVTIIVVPHERYNVALKSLDSIYNHISEPFNLVYVDINSPEYVSKALQKRQKKYGFTIIRKDQFIQPNAARNLGIELCNTPYIVFIDNDVIVTEGWLNALVECAETTGAWLVGPLIIETDGKKKSVIHSTVAESQYDVNSGILLNVMHNHKDEIGQLMVSGRQPCELLEYHCILIKKEGLDAIGGYIDEGIKNTRSHMDLCFLIKNAGGEIYFEPGSRISYYRYFPLEDNDDENYLNFHYNENDIIESIRYFQKKWNVKLENERFSIVRGRKNQFVKKYRNPLIHKIKHLLNAY